MGRMSTEKDTRKDKPKQKKIYSQKHIRIALMKQEKQTIKYKQKI